MARGTAGGTESARDITDWRADAFARMDEEPDVRFYNAPRFVQHIDEGAIAAVTETIRHHVPPGADVLDLMSSWVSHLPAPAELPLGRVAGVGMNADELKRNPRLTEWTIQDLNVDSRLPYANASFGAVLITVSIQYLTRPDLVLRDVARVLIPAACLSSPSATGCFPPRRFASGRRPRRKGARHSSPPTSTPPVASTVRSSRSIAPAPAGSVAIPSGLSSPAALSTSDLRPRRDLMGAPHRRASSWQPSTRSRSPLVTKEEGAVD